MLASSKDKFKFLILIIVSMNVRILDRVGLRPQLKGNEKRVSGIARPPAALALLRLVYPFILNRPSLPWSIEQAGYQMTFSAS
jgi:hypothetical protein